MDARTRPLWLAFGLICLVVAVRGLRPSSEHRLRSRHYTDAAEADRVYELPGAAEDLDFGMFAGYVTVSEVAGRALYYVFTERPAAAGAPLVLWLNGGPGCSSLGGGLMSELGPFYPKVDGKALLTNPFAWNKLASIIFLESPAFVGFSYSNTSSDALVGDMRTAFDARQCLLGWLERFPQYQASDFYIAGESYGGHYVPNLALEIVKGNKRAAASRGGSSSSIPGVREGHINLKGIFVGNAWTDAATDNLGTLDFWYTHAMIGEDSYQGIKANCDFNVIGPLMRGAQALTLPGTHSSSSGGAGGAGGDSSRDSGSSREFAVGHARVRGFGRSSGDSEERDITGDVTSGSHDHDRDFICAKWLDVAANEQGNINIYEIYADVCVPDEAPSSSSSSSLTQRQAKRKYMGALLGDVILADVATGGASAAAAVGHPHRRPRYDPCIDGEVEIYMNLPKVQAALNVNQTIKLPWRWTSCTTRISYSRADLLSSMLPVYKQLLAEPGLKLWVFSGDVDGIVPVLGSRRWVAGLGLPTVKAWRPWTSSTGQVGGWRIDYAGLTFATVRNAGHMVPYVQPERAFHLFREFLQDQPAPSSSR